eukprot:scaffold8427_cov69-Skeletonema_dohrnii-CCMP3373.AAC.3
MAAYLSQNLQMREGPITDADGLADITATAADGEPLITSTSWPFHIVAYRSSWRALGQHQKRVPGRQERVPGGKRPQLLSQPGTQCVSSVGVTANPNFSSGSNMVNPNIPSNFYRQLSCRL